MTQPQQIIGTCQRISSGSDQVQMSGRWCDVDLAYLSYLYFFEVGQSYTAEALRILRREGFD